MKDFAQNEWPLIAIVGPTGSGKSSLALHIAQRHNGEIVNCDSLQVYRHFDIGTAKTPIAERRGVAHHLFDIVNPDEVFTAGDYARIGRETLVAIKSRGKVPVVAGGTGFYLRALLDGLFEGPARDPLLRERLAARERKRKGSLARLLARFDPEAAGRIHSNDRNKLIRALEVCIVARRPLTQLHSEGSPPLSGFQPLLIGLDPPREELYTILNHRCGAMFEAGLVAEVKQIMAMGYGVSCKPFESIGYKHALWLIEEKYAFNFVLEELRKDTRHYAKRQWTWFKRDTRVSWIPGFGHSPQVQQRIDVTLLKSLFQS